MASDPITSWEIDGETVDTVADFIFLGSKITADIDCSLKICQQRSVWSRLWFFQWSCMDVRVGL